MGLLRVVAENLVMTQAAMTGKVVGEIEIPCSHLRSIDGDGEAFPRTPQCFFRLLSLGNVRRNTKDADNLVGGVSGLDIEIIPSRNARAENMDLLTRGSARTRARIF